MFLRQSLAQVRDHQHEIYADFLDGLMLEDMGTSETAQTKHETTTEFDADPARTFPWSDDDSE